MIARERERETEGGAIGTRDRRGERGRDLGVYLSKKLLLISQSALTRLTSPLRRSRSRYRQGPRRQAAHPTPLT